MKVLIFTFLLIFGEVRAADEGKTNAFGLSGRAATLTTNCQVCTEAEFVPAFSKSDLESWNITDYNDYSSLPTCGPKTEKTCESGEVCAKKTTIYKILDQGYEYKTFVRICTPKNLHGTVEIPISGQCYDDKSPDASKKANGVEKSSTWCYCRNENLCNKSNGLQIWFGTMISTLLISWIFSN